MKKHIFTLLFALVALTGCNNDEYYYQTPGEITGEKITELVTSGGQKAKCIVEGIKKLNLPIIQYLREDYITYNPAQPDDWNNFQWYDSPFTEIEKPDGN